MIIALSGVDGSGKTTLSKEIVERLKQKGLKAMRFYLGDYFLLSGFVRLLHFSQTLFRRESGRQIRGNPFLGTRRKPTLLKFWLLVTMIDNFLNYIRLRYYSCLGYLVVCDRYFYDKLIGFEYHGYSSQSLSWLYLKLTPSPNLTFILDLDEKISQKREASGPHALSFYKEIRERYRKLGDKVKCEYISVGDKQKKEALECALKYIKSYQSRLV